MSELDSDDVSNGEAPSTTQTYVLGAGFSRAVSPSMPLLNELGRRVHELDGVLRDRVSSHEILNFENWMSQVATPEPYRNRAENHDALSLYSRAVIQIGRVLQGEVSVATEGALPDWLTRLVQMWHTSKATVATFNYDTLAEIAARRGNLFDPSDRLVLPWQTVINFAPPGNDRTIGEDSRNITWSSFRLLKLHGSINWYWVPDDSSGATLERVPLFDGAVDDEKAFDSSRWLPGREPYIVPPVATKSVFYGGPLTTHLWQSAGRALRKTTELVIMGYSMPVTDLTTLGLLQESLRDKRALSIVVCDLNPDDVVDRLEKLLPTDIHLDVATFKGENAIEQYVDDRWASARKEAIADLRIKLVDAGEMPLSVNARDQRMQQVSSFTRSGESLTVRASNSFHAAMWRDDADLNPEEGIGSSYFLAASALATALDGCVELKVQDRFGEAEVWGGRPLQLAGRQWFDLYANLADSND